MKLVKSWVKRVLKNRSSTGLAAVAPVGDGFGGIGKIYRLAPVHPS